MYFWLNHAYSFMSVLSFCLCGLLPVLFVWFLLSSFFRFVWFITCPLCVVSSQFFLSVCVVYYLSSLCGFLSVISVCVVYYLSSLCGGFMSVLAFCLCGFLPVLFVWFHVSSFCLCDLLPVLFVWFLVSSFCLVVYYLSSLCGFMSVLSVCVVY